MKNISKALSEFQAKCPLIKKDATNPFFKSKYAPLDSILPIVLPLLKEVGLVITQIPTGNGLRTILSHIESGEILEGTADLILDKQTPQGQGSAITYMRRYALVSMLGLNTEEDDDGNISSKPPVKLKADEKQIKLIRGLLVEKDKKEEPILTTLKVNKLEDITPKQAEAIINQLNK